MGQNKRTVFSSLWHNAAHLKPRLLPHTRFYAHVYRGKRWYILQDSSSGRYHRLSPGSYHFLRKMNGKCSVQQLWDEACKEGGDSLPTQNEVIELLTQLHSNDLLLCDVTPDAAELFHRHKKRKWQKWKQWLMQPMSLKFPLVNPERFLDRYVPYIVWMFSVKGALLWLLVVIPALILAGLHWEQLSENVSDRVLATDNLFLLFIIFPVIKLLHELGHGFATKVWGLYMRWG